MNILRLRYSVTGLVVFCFFSMAAASDQGGKGPVFAGSKKSASFMNRTEGVPAKLNATDATYLYYVENTYGYSTLGLDYDASTGLFWYAHESQSSKHNPTIYLIEHLSSTHKCNVVKSIAPSSKNSGWPWQLDNRDGMDIMPNGNLLAADYNGDLSRADDNIIEMTPDGIIVNAWEMDNEVGSNDSKDGSKIDNIIDVAVIEVDDNTIHAYVTAAYDDWVIYEIKLTRTGTWWTPKSWYTVRTVTGSVNGDNLGIDIMGEKVVVSDWDGTNLYFYNQDLTLLDSLNTDGGHNGGYHSGVCFLDGTEPLETAVTDFDSDETEVFDVGFVFNSPPEISNISNQTGHENQAVGPVDFTIFDAETDPSALILTAVSDNQTLIPDANISLGGTGKNRTITLTPAAYQHGSAVITVTVEDVYGATASDALDVTINPEVSVIYINTSTGSDDSGTGLEGAPFATLSHAVTLSTDGDTLDLTGTLAADGTSTDNAGIEITKSLIIRGQGAIQTFVQGNASGSTSSDRRCFTIASGKTVTIKDMTLQYGNTSTTGGGAILNQGTLTLENCVIEDNATGGSTYHGGGIYNTGSLALSNCTVQNNTGGNGGGIYTTGNLSIEKTTFYANTASTHGGGFALNAEENDLDFSLISSTVSGNTASSGNGGGLYLVSGGTYTMTVTVTNATLADNSCSGSGNGVYEETSSASSAVNSTYTNTILDNTITGNYAQNAIGTHSLTRTYTICRDASMDASGDGNQNNTDAGLGTLADNGGDTKTHAISGSSPAIDTGTSKGVPDEDQRGASRPQGIGYDIGAYERTPQTYYVNSNTGVDDASQDGSEMFPWATISYAIGRSEVGNSDVLNLDGTFTADGAAASGITVNKSLNLIGQLLSETIIQGHSSSAASSDRRCFTIESDKTVTMQNLTIRYGNPGSENGGGILNNGSLYLMNCTIEDNTAINGGGIYSSYVLQMLASTVSGNTASGNGGGIYSYLCDPSSVSGGINSLGLFHLYMLNCTVANNSAGTLTGNGGGLYLHAQSVSGITQLNANLTHITIASNLCGTSGNGNSIYRYAESASLVSQTYLLMINSILFSSTSNNYADGTSGALTSHSLERSYTLCRDATLDETGSGNLNSTDPQLSVLANNGGLTETMALLLSSPAINTGGETFLTTDQRGFPHVGIPDMGAYEYGTYTPLQAEIKVFLEGAYDSGTHRMLNSISVPVKSPYSEDDRTVAEIPNDVVDWVLVELRTTADGAAVVYRSAFLRDDGFIVSDDGTATTIDVIATPGYYYIVVKHRNHLSIMSDETHLLSVGVSTLYDFTVDASTAYDKYYGGEAALLETGVYGMSDGDPNASGGVNATDYLTVKAEIGSSGYYDRDCNLSGTVNATDYLVIKPNVGINTQVP